MELCTYVGAKQDVHLVTLSLCIQVMQLVHITHKTLVQIHNVYPEILTGEDIMMEIIRQLLFMVQNISYIFQLEKHCIKNTMITKYLVLCVRVKNVSMFI